MQYTVRVIMTVIARATVVRGVRANASKDTKATTAQGKVVQWDGHWPISPLEQTLHIHSFSAAIKEHVILKQEIVFATAVTRVKVARPRSATTIVTDEESASVCALRPF